MEFGMSRTKTKSPSKFSGILHRFVKVCRFVSPGVPSGVDISHELHKEECSTKETECGDGNYNGKIYPQPSRKTLVQSGVDVDSVMIQKLFDAVSSMKLAYIQFQRAHIPYDPEKIRSADELLMSQLRSMSDIEQLYLETQKNKPPSLVSLNAEILQQEELLEKLQYQAQAKDSEMLKLGWEIEELVQKNMELEQEIQRNLSPEDEILMSYKDLNPDLFQPAYEAAYRAIHEFAKPLIGLMKASGWNLDRAADSIAPSVFYPERSHKKYAFEVFISRKMFSPKGFSEEKCKSEDICSVLRFQDGFDALVVDPDSDFAHFCASKYLSVVHQDMELAFFGNLDQRNFVLSGKHPRTAFYRAFVKMARWLWVLLVIAAKIVPAAKMFYAEKGAKFVAKHMDSVLKVEGSFEFNVGFTVTPGFWIADGEVVRCRVYPEHSSEQLRMQ